MPIYKKEIKYVDTVKYKEFDTCVAIELKHHIKGDHGFFMSRKEWDAKSQKYNNNLIEVALNVERPYVYHKQEFWKKFRKEGLEFQENFNSFWDMQIKPFNAIKNKLFSSHNLVWIDESSDLLYKLDAEYPMVQPYWVGYIGGLAARNIATGLRPISMKERQKHRNRKGFYWNPVSGEKPIVSPTQKPCNRSK